MKTKLITGLRAAANALENGLFPYSWNEQSMCNCGVLVCSLTGMSAAALSKKIPESVEFDNPTWSRLAKEHCPITGMPTEALFKQLLSFGLSASDIIGLEFLNDSKVLRRMKLSDMNAGRKWWQKKHKTTIKDNKSHAILYMRAWADLLTEEGAMDAAPKTEAKEAIANFSKKK